MKRLLLATIIGLSILMALGTWQVFRLNEKTKLIAALEARMAASPISIAEAITRQANGEDVEYLKVTAAGELDLAHAMRKIISVDGKAGWEVIIPLLTSDNIFMLVDVGQVPDVAFNQTGKLTTSLEGIIRNHNKGRGRFDNDNDVSGNVWYWWDIPTMQHTAPETARIAPFVLQRLPSTDANLPFAPLPKVELRNNHLGYAITWFGLAAALAGVAAFFARSMMLDQRRRDG